MARKAEEPTDVVAIPGPIPEAVAEPETPAPRRTGRPKTTAEPEAEVVAG